MELLWLCSLLSICGRYTINEQTDFKHVTTNTMEVKVSVDGVPRVVCGVTDKTTCQEVVIALAQALGRPGRYTLKEQFKDFERCMTPNEHLLGSLQKYGQQARDVQLTLHHNGPSICSNELQTPKGGKFQLYPQMRNKEAGSMLRRGSGSLSLHRQSLPPISHLRHDTAQPSGQVKMQRRKSLTLLEEAWGWLESLSKGRGQYTTCNERKETGKRSSSTQDNSAPYSLQSPFRDQNCGKSGLDHETSCCIANQTRDKESKRNENPFARSAAANVKGMPNSSSARKIEDKKCKLRENIIGQLSHLQDLQAQIAFIDLQIRELEEHHKAWQAKEATQQKLIEEETEQVQFWENELKAEEGYEKDLQNQFLEMKEKAMDCKAKLEEYKCKIQGMNFFGIPIPRKGGANDPIEILPLSDDHKQLRADPNSNVKNERKSPPREDSKIPHGLVNPSQIKDRNPAGPTELREWWARLSTGQTSQHSKQKIIHRSELTIYLASTKI